MAKVLRGQHGDEVSDSDDDSDDEMYPPGMNEKHAGMGQKYGADHPHINISGKVPFSFAEKQYMIKFVEEYKKQAKVDNIDLALAMRHVTKR